MAPSAVSRKRKISDRIAHSRDHVPTASDDLTTGHETADVNDHETALGDLDFSAGESDDSDGDVASFSGSDNGLTNGDEEDELDSDEIPSSEDEAESGDQRLGVTKGSNSNRPNGLAIQANDLLNGQAEDNGFDESLDANGNPRYLYREIEPDYDSDDSDLLQATNTIGNIPLSYYDEFPHIGYDINGKKISRPAKGGALDALLDSIDLPEGWTGLTDPTTGQALNLDAEQLDMLKKLTRNEAPGEGYDPYPDMVEWFTSREEIMPLSAAPEPKRRFVPSKHEQKRVMKMVKAIKEGRIKPHREPAADEEQEDAELKNYDIWADEVPRPDHPMNIVAPKLPPPGYEESYHPPAEYLPDAAERKAWEEADEEDRDKDFLPNDHTALRRVPGFERLINNRFERCLDLYLAPRVRRSKLNIDPESLLPKLPSPEELRPFPTVCAMTYVGHQGRVRCVAVHQSGQLIATGGDDGTVRVWNLFNGRQVWSVKVSTEDIVSAVRWRPGPGTGILSFAVAETMYLAIPPGVDLDDTQGAADKEVLDAGFGYATMKQQDPNKPKAATWARPLEKLVEKDVYLSITCRSAIKVINWHRRGDYFTTVSPSASSQAIGIHTLSKHLTQHPFRRLKGLAQTASFHPSRPLFFVATRQSVRVYDLQQQKLEKTLQPGARWISSMDVHSGGDNVLVGSYDRRLLWHDLDLGTVPHKTLRYHEKAIRAVKFHPAAGTYPLFADASDDGSIQIFHGKVVNDSLENATIVPLKVLKGHKVTRELGVLDLDWHPTQPWLFTAGADGSIRQWN